MKQLTGIDKLRQHSTALPHQMNIGAVSVDELQNGPAEGLDLPGEHPVQGDPDLLKHLFAQVFSAGHHWGSGQHTDQIIVGSEPFEYLFLEQGGAPVYGIRRFAPFKSKNAVRHDDHIEMPVHPTAHSRILKLGKSPAVWMLVVIRFNNLCALSLALLIDRLGADGQAAIGMILPEPRFRILSLIHNAAS
jgi:hypothetical protein